MDNERRATLGQQAIALIADETNVSRVESAETAVTDVLSYVAHFCDRLGIDPADTFERGLSSYRGDEEDGPFAAHTMNAADHLTR